VENAICGIWGGYSSGAWIVRNFIARNGGMAYGLERGGINLEHASGNRILENEFQDNKCAVHLWWDNDATLLRLPGVAGNDRGVRDNVIARNKFALTARHPFGGSQASDPLVVLQLRNDGAPHVRDNVYVDNTVRLTAPHAVEFLLEPGTEPLRQGDGPPVQMPRVTILGKTRPVGARESWMGRDQILLDEWGPWDHENPLLRTAPGVGPEVVYELLGVRSKPRLEIQRGPLIPTLTRLKDRGWRLALLGPEGVTSYRAVLRAPDFEQTLEGTLIGAQWEASFFPWTVDPREDLKAWRQLADGPRAIQVRTPSLDFAYGWGGPRDQPWAAASPDRAPGPDHFGMIARTRLRLPAGEWRFTTQSDDGVRVLLNGEPVIENWTWHGPTRDEGTYTQAADGEVSLEVEHFEIDGYAVLKLDLEAFSR
jgi:hypothetical protein